MPQTKFYPKNSAPGQTFGLTTYTPDLLDPQKKYMLWLVGHGKGERSDGSLAGIQRAFNWGGWGNIKTAAGKYDFILVFVNTDNNYEKGEYQFALQWATSKLPIDPKNINIISHSLGGYGAGNYAYPDANFTNKINIWFNSASGPYSNAATFQNIASANVKVWGVTATNDTKSGTSPIYVTQVYDKVKAFNPSAHILTTVFPSTTWLDPLQAHNAVLNRLTGITWTGIDVSMFGRTLTMPPKMNIYEWALSNPKGSIYQAPSELYTGPKYEQPDPEPDPDPVPDPDPIPDPDPVPDPDPIPDPTPTPKIVNRNGFNIVDSDLTRSSFTIDIAWEGAEMDRYKVKNVYFSDKSSRLDLTLVDGTKISVNKTKQV